jgi:hypothetical protein
MELHERIELVRSKEDLADFVLALRLDLDANPGGWENPTLDRFLDALEDLIRGLDNVSKNTGQPLVQQPTWQTFAAILYASKIYE